MLGGSKRGANGKILVEDLPELIEQYFETCKPKYVMDKDGKQLLDGEKPMFTMNAPTMNGLCRFLGYSSVAYMNNVMRHPNSPRASVLQKAILRIAEWHESRLGDKNSQGSQFWLKSAQKELWGDKPQVHMIGAVGADLQLTEDEAKQFKYNMEILFKKPDDIEIEEDEEEILDTEEE